MLTTCSNVWLHFAWRLTRRLAQKFVRIFAWSSLENLIQGLPKRRVSQNLFLDCLSACPSHFFKSRWRLASLQASFETNLLTPFCWRMSLGLGGGCTKRVTVAWQRIKANLSYIFLVHGCAHVVQSQLATNRSNITCFHVWVTYVSTLAFRDGCQSKHGALHAKKDTEYETLQRERRHIATLGKLGNIFKLVSTPREGRYM